MRLEIDRDSDRKLYNRATSNLYKDLRALAFFSHIEIFFFYLLKTAVYPECE